MKQLEYRYFSITPAATKYFAVLDSNRQIQFLVVPRVLTVSSTVKAMLLLVVKGVGRATIFPLVCRPKYTIRKILHFLYLQKFFAVVWTLKWSKATSRDGGG